MGQSVQDSSPFPSSTLLTGPFAGAPADQCFAPIGLTAAGNDFDVAVGIPTCYHASFEFSDSGLRMVTGETFPVTVHGQPGANVLLALGLPQAPLVAWLSKTSVAIGPDGNGNSTLYLAGGYVSSSTSTSSTVPLVLTIATGSTEDLESIPIPVEPTYPVYNVGSGEVIRLPDMVVAPGESSIAVWGIADVPGSATQPSNLNLTLNAAGVISNGNVQPAPSWLKLWFSDQDAPVTPSSTQALSAMIQPGQVHYFFTTVSVSGSGTVSYGEYPMAVSLLVNGATLQSSVSVDVVSSAGQR